MQQLHLNFNPWPHTTASQSLLEFSYSIPGRTRPHLSLTFDIMSHTTTCRVRCTLLQFHRSIQLLRLTSSHIQPYVKYSSKCNSNYFNHKLTALHPFAWHHSPSRAPCSNDFLHASFKCNSSYQHLNFASWVAKPKLVAPDYEDMYHYDKPLCFPSSFLMPCRVQTDTAPNFASWGATPCRARRGMLDYPHEITTISLGRLWHCVKPRLS